MKTEIKRSTVLAIMLLLVACASPHVPEAHPAMEPPTSEPRAAPLEPGDAVRVSFSHEPEQSGTYQVDVSGEVAFPFLGTRSVGEVAPDSLRSGLMSDYRSRLRNQTIEVFLLRRVRILGAVGDPGLYHIDGTMTLADVVAEAGGATSDGSLDEIQVIRGDRVVLSDVEAGAGALQTLRSGDQVFVPRRSWFARNSGVVIGGLISTIGFVVSVVAF